LLPPFLRSVDFSHALLRRGNHVSVATQTTKSDAGLYFHDHFFVVATLLVLVLPITLRVGA